MVALRAVKFYQKSGCLILSRAGFSRLVKDIAQDFKNNLRLSEKAATILQYATEKFIVKLGEKALICAIYARRHTLLPKDIDLAMRLGMAVNIDSQMTSNAPVSAHNLNFGIYIQKVLKQVHPSIKLSSDASSQITFLINVLAKNIAIQAASVARVQNQVTIRVKEVQQAIRNGFPGELSSHVVAEGNKAVTRVNSVGKDGVQKSSQLQFRVSRCRKFLKECSSQRVSNYAGVYLASVLEYITAEILELAGYIVIENKKSVIKARDISLGIKNDEELNSLFGERGLNVELLGGGVQPNIHAFLLPKKNTKST